MFVFDTNVLSEVMKATPDPAVVNWLTSCPAEMMFTTTICQTEILYGLRRLPDSQRRQRLTVAAEALFTQELVGRILPFDAATAVIYADLRIARERAGRPLAVEDGMIAAIARVVGASVVTRNTEDFAGCGILVINPWQT